MKDRDSQPLSGRNRRLCFEWNRLDERLSKRKDIDYVVTQWNTSKIPTRYLVTYYIRSICGVEHVEELKSLKKTLEQIYTSITSDGSI